MKRALLGLAMLWGAAAAVVGSGCTKAEPPRSFVQPNALRKSDFNGTWYYNATVIDAPPTNGNIYIGQYGELQKIKWVVSEDTLFAVRAFAFVTNQEDPQTGTHANVDGQSQYEGEPLAAWHIQSHFDIIRDYNPSTGEETNRIIESQERPWNEREYFRVDWSKNLAPDFSGIGLDFTFGGVEFTDIGYYVSDPTSADAIHAERADQNDADLGFAEGEMNYLDITAQMIAQPSEQEFVIDEAGNTEKLPSCFAWYGTEDCAAQKVKLRHSFAKKAPNDTYEKRRWDGIDQENFGFFTTELRHNWNRQYGDLYSGDTRWVERFNLFKQSCRQPGTTCEAPHRVRDLFPGPTELVPSWLTTFTDADIPGNQYRATGANLSEYAAVSAGLLQNTAPSPDGGVIPVAIPADKYLLEGTDHVPASQDTNWIPYQQRQQHTIPYYANEEMGEDIWVQSKEIINQWNKVFKHAVADLYNYDPLTNKVVDSKTADQMQDVFVWCHNPVHQDDPKACFEHLKPDLNPDGTAKLDSNGNKVYRVRQGDPRYSSIIWINEFQAGGPLGLGPALADPETGETISSKANIYGGDLDTYASWARDLLQLMNGEIDPNTYIQGINAASWVKANQAGVQNQMPGYTPQDTADHLEAMDFSWAAGKAGAPYRPKGGQAGTKQIIDSVNQSLLSGLFAETGGDLQQAMLDKVRNTPMEAKLMTSEMQLSMGLDPRMDFASLTASQKSRYSALNTGRMHTIRSQNRMQMESFGYDFEPFNYNVMGGEAQRYKGMDPMEVWRDIRDRVYIAVTLHEVGHNMGLRHNFRGSYDAMNYFDGYWQNRYNAAATDHPQDLSDAGKVKLYPRNYRDPADPNHKPGAYTDGEVKNGELEMMYSSIMDYGAAWDTDLQGLGKYDYAAIKYGYANHVEVFNNAANNLSNTSDQLQLDRLGRLQDFKDYYGFPSAIQGNPTNAGARAINYFTFPDLMKGDYTDLASRKDVPLYAIDDRNFTAPNLADRAQPYTTSVKAALDDNGNLLPMVPYFFCSDEFVGNLTCQRFDFGADAYEQAHDIISRYENWYLIRNFKRDAYAFHSGPRYADYTYERYYEILHDQQTWLTLLNADWVDQAVTWSSDMTGINFGSDPQYVKNFFSDSYNGWGTFTDAVTDGFVMLADVLAAPQAGTFLGQIQPNGNIILKQIADEADPTFANQPGLENMAATLDITQGRYQETTWNFSGCGYFWGDECQTRIGYYTDKYLALKMLSEMQAYFTGRDTSVDVRKYAIGYYVPFKNQIDNIFSALMSGEATELGQVYVGKNEAPQKQDFIFRTPVTASGNNPLVVFDPELGFSLQMWAGVFGLSGFTSGFDHNFTNNTQVFVVGNGEAPVPDSSLLNSDGTAGPLATFDPGQIKSACAPAAPSCLNNKKEWLVFTDKSSGKTYAARATPRVRIRAPGNQSNWSRVDVGARMLEHTKVLADQLGTNPNDPILQQQYTEFTQNLDMMRSLHAAFGYGPYYIDQ